MTRRNLALAALAAALLAPSLALGSLERAADAPGLTPLPIASGLQCESLAAAFTAEPGPFGLHAGAEP